jgi:hypothetical protein
MKIKLPEGVGICIQGPTDFTDICYFWNGFDCPVVWSTWETEPAKNILKIERSGIEVILSPKPNYSGYLNFNMQSTSTRVGLTRLKELGVNHAVKVRSDMIFSGIETVWQEIVGCDISFMHSYNPKYCPELAYCLDGIYHVGLDFTLDHIVFGNIDTMLYVFGGHEHWNRPIPPESIILKRWLDYRNLVHDFRPEYLKQNGLVYFGPIAMKHSKQVLWLKNNWDFTGIMHNEPNQRIY